MSRSYTSSPPMYLHVMQRDSFTFIFLLPYSQPNHVGYNSVSQWLPTRQRSFRRTLKVFFWHLTIWIERTGSWTYRKQYFSVASLYFLKCFFQHGSLFLTTDHFVILLCWFTGNNYRSFPYQQATWGSLWVSLNVPSFNYTCHINFIDTNGSPSNLVKY
jgi:hypothetical protein